jgi:hypothetical protein
MDEFFLRLFSASIGGGIDWAAVFAFIAAAVFYFLAPVIGYRIDRRGPLAVSMYLLIGYAGLALIQVFVQYTSTLGQGAAMRGDSNLHLFFAFVMLKMIAFIAAMILLVVGLQTLRLRIPTEADEHFRSEGGPRG